MDHTINSNIDFMHFSEFYLFFFCKNFPIALKKSPARTNILLRLPISLLDRSSMAIMYLFLLWTVAGHIYYEHKEQSHPPLITTRLTDFGLPQHIVLGASVSCEPTPVGHTNRWQGFLDLIFPTDTKPSSSLTSTDHHIKYPYLRPILLHMKDIAEPAWPLDINTLHSVHVVEELLQLTRISDAVIISNSH